MSPLDIREISDRMEISGALLAYSTALDTPGRRWDLWYDCFTQDAVCEFSTTGVKTAAELQETFKQNDAVRLSTQHLMLNIVISIDGDTASARSECLYAAVNRGDALGEQILRLSGLWFEDICVRTDKGWRISNRVGHLRWTKEIALDASETSS